MSTAALVQSIKPRIERWRFWRTRFGQLLKSWFGIGRRWGVRFNGGDGEKTGFYYRKEAENWIQENAKDGEVFYYEPIDTWLPGAERRGRYSGAPPKEG
jgi:hypothetical protein